LYKSFYSQSVYKRILPYQVLMMNNNKNLIIASLLGNILEFYDFTIYSIFAIEIGATFFAQYDPISQTILSLLVFSIGFIARPIGGILFGHLGDKYGRKAALTTSLMIMAFTTLLIGILPSYETIGLLASFSIAILRFIQGISVAGEGVGTALYILESLKIKRIGFIGSLIAFSNIIGMFLAIIVGIIINKYFVEQDKWRLAYILGSLIGIIGLYLRFYLKETTEFKKAFRNGNISKFPLFNLINSNWRGMVQVCLLGGLCGATVHLIISYLNIYLISLGFDKSYTLKCTFISMVIFSMLMPLSGLVSDFIGYSNVLKIACIIIILSVIPSFLVLQSTISFKIHSLILVLFGFFAASVNGPAYKNMLEVFKVEQRYTGMAFSYNLGVAVFGSTLPVVSIILHSKNINYGAGIHIIIVALLLLLNLYSTKLLQPKLYQNQSRYREMAHFQE
jgi:MFS transporter, MHS family, proline/betaine transporter